MARFVNITDIQANELREKKEPATTSKSTKVGFKCFEAFIKETHIEYNESSLLRLGISLL